MHSVTLMRRIAARPSIVFEALTTAEGVASWWGPAELPVILAETDPRVGGRFRVRFNTADGKEHEASGEFIDVDPPRRVVMTWRWTYGGEPDEIGRTSRVEMELAPVNGGVELTLTHAELATEVSAVNHENGWGGAMNKLVQNMDEPARA